MRGVKGTFRRFHERLNARKEVMPNAEARRTDFRSNTLRVVTGGPAERITSWSVSKETERQD